MTQKISTFRNEQIVATAFNKQSAVFDSIYSSNRIIQYKRDRVRVHIEKFLKPGSRILELNAGTGEDAIYFAGHGHSVHATDIAPGMQSMLQQKVDACELTGRVTHEICSFTTLGSLRNKGPYDLVFSNFAGLNCTGELGKVLQSIDSLLNPGGMVTFVILPPFCLWETLLIFKGKYKTAFRRWFSGRGVGAHIEGEYFTCWYYPPSYIIRHMKKAFRLYDQEGLCTIVPPSYIEHFAEKHSEIYHFLKSKEDKLKARWPWKNIGDYYIISLRKND